jgi:transcriptional regulator with XRE-family HTH domain
MKNPTDLHIGQRVRHRRWLQGMTQQQLAQEIGIRFQQVQKYECGANRISAARLWEIARALDAAVSSFFDGLHDSNQSLGIDDSGDVALHQKETLDLVRSYYAMDERPRRRLLELIKAISKQDPHNDKSRVQTAYTL